MARRNFVATPKPTTTGYHGAAEQAIINKEAARLDAESATERKIGMPIDDAAILKDASNIKPRIRKGSRANGHKHQ